MAMSTSCYSSMPEEQAKMEVEEEPQPSTSAAAAQQVESQEHQQFKGVEHEKELIRLRAEMICVGCRCGWLCCDCALGCLSCKQRRRFCYCRWVPAAGTGKLVRVPCINCTDIIEKCTCDLAWRCKWCKVSIQKCRRGGCLTLLPNRRSPEADVYVEIFNKEDKSEDEDLDSSLEKTMEKLSLAESCSNFSWESNSSRRSSFSEASSGSEVTQEREWWQIQATSTTAAAAASSTEETETVSDTSSSGDDSTDSRYDSSGTLSSMSSGGSYSSVGGKSDC